MNEAFYLYVFFVRFLIGFMIAFSVGFDFHNIWWLLKEPFVCD